MNRLFFLTVYIAALFRLRSSFKTCLSGQRTIGGSANGSCCVFPFRYGNRLYHTCTKLYHDRPWCATTKDYHHDRLWGNCVNRTNCKDKYTFCKEWGKAGLCKRSSNWYRTAKVNCPVTCGVCVRDNKTKGPIYYIGKSPKTWTEAENICVGWGGHLASFTSREDETDVCKKLDVGLPYWIGLYSSPDKTIYKWTDGTPYRYVFWDFNEPNGGQNETCVGIKRWFLGFYMHDAPCSNKASFICEKEL